jgi:hypothetical protein
MLYSILIYDSEPVVKSWSRQEDDAVVARHVELQDRLRTAGNLGPVVRLTSTGEAVTVRTGTELLVTDGPYTETKEALLGLYVVDCASIDEVINIIRQMPNKSGAATFEIRPVCWYEPGGRLEELK